MLRSLLLYSLAARVIYHFYLLLLILKIIDFIHDLINHIIVWKYQLILIINWTVHQKMLLFAATDLTTQELIT